jgi:hypothetical protein
MRKLWFVVPVHGRLGLTKICLRHLRLTCDALLERDVKATAVVISDADTLDVLNVGEFGFGWVIRDNQFTSRRFNDGIQLATDPKFNPAPADFVVPFGSDDWADYRLFAEPLPKRNQIFGFQHMAFVREDGREISTTFLDYQGGSGIRIIPRELVAPLGYRPADEDRERGCDTSILTNIRREHGDKLDIRHWHMNDYQIVDWKTGGEQLNAYKSVTTMRTSEVEDDPFAALAPYYDAEALEEMEQHYFGVKVVAA